MECKYTKYTILEIVPIELKSYSTPIFTIFNSVLLWIYLIVYYIYILLSALILGINNFIHLFKNKYSQNKEHLETYKFVKNGTRLESLLNIKSDRVTFIRSESEIFKGKYAKDIFDYLREDSSVHKSFLEEIDLRLLGSFTIRKDIITVRVDNQETKDIIEDQILFTRGFSDPVKKYLDFMLKKIF